MKVIYTDEEKHRILEMIIKIRDIPRDGLEVKETISPQDIALEDNAFLCLSPLEISGKVDHVDETIIAKINVSGNYEFACGRCLDPIRKEHVETFEFYFDINRSTEFIDLGEDLRQELVIALSRIMLCDENCAGICPNCGMNLNHQSCLCSDKA